MDLLESNVLTNGTLTFDVYIKPDDEFYVHCTPHQPILGNEFTKLMNDEEMADVSFKVGNKLFYAQKCILKMRAPKFNELASQFDQDAPMPNLYLSPT